MCACTVQTHLDAAGITLASRDLTRVVLLCTDAFFFSFAILQQPLSELPLSILTSLWTVETSKIATVGRLPVVGAQYGLGIQWKITKRPFRTTRNMRCDTVHVIDRA